MYDNLKERTDKPSKIYCEILQLAKREGESDVKLALELMLGENSVPTTRGVMTLIEKSRTRDVKGEVMPVSLRIYDELHQFKGAA